MKKGDPAKFGWCMDGHHEGCRITFTHEERTYTCACDCHKEGMIDG